jgi:Na+/H+ antiporter NhaD/arsenite permease-like protein
MDIASIVSVSIFLVTFFFILTERIHRTVIAFAGAVAMIIAGTALNFYSPEAAVTAIDFNTIALLFGMMVLVVMLENTGFFQYLGILTAKKSKGNPWVLLVSLGLLTSVLSMVLDNVTTIILIAPVTIIIARTLNISPVPILLAEAMLSNVGGAGTLIGDPPNIIIGSAANFSFNDFLVHSLPVVAVAWIGSLLVFRFLFHSQLNNGPSSIERLQAMNEREAIHDPVTLKRILIILAGTIVLFFLHGALHLEPAMVALIGSATALLAVNRKSDPQPIIKDVELSVLLFFASLFVLVGGLEHTGVLQHVSNLLLTGAADNILMTAIIVMWASAVLSAIVDNIPMTVAMIPIFGGLEAQGIPIELLWWALVFGVGFGGNISPIGSSAGVIVVGKAEQTEHPISFIEWMKTGVPASIAALAIATVGLTIYHHIGLPLNEDTPQEPAAEQATVPASQLPGTVLAELSDRSTH